MARTYQRGHPYTRAKPVKDPANIDKMHAAQNVKSHAGRVDVGVNTHKRATDYEYHSKRFETRMIAQRNAAALREQAQNNAASLAISKSDYNRQQAVEYQKAAARRNTELPQGLQGQTQTSSILHQSGAGFAANMLRVFVVIAGMAVVYLMVATPKGNQGATGATFFSKLGGVLINLTSGKPIFTIVNSPSTGTQATVPPGPGGTSTTGTPSSSNNGIPNTHGALP